MSVAAVHSSPASRSWTGLFIAASLLSVITLWCVTLLGARGLYWLWLKFLRGFFSYPVGIFYTLWFGALFAPASVEPWRREAQGALVVCLLTGLLALAGRIAFHVDELNQRRPSQRTLARYANRQSLGRSRIYLGMAVILAMQLAILAALVPTSPLYQYRELRWMVPLGSTLIAPLLLAWCLIPRRA